MDQFALSSFFVGAAVVLGSWPALAQSTQPPNPQPILPANSATPSSTEDIYFINRAKNLARQAAITANGGLERYRPDSTMFGPAIQTQYLRNGDGSITFSFKGSTPGKVSPSIETVATVLPTGAVNLDYNGPLRNIGAGTLPLNRSPQTQSSQLSVPLGLPPTSPINPATAILPTTSPNDNGDRSDVVGADEDAFLARARNLARQAAIKANGGLSRYRPEASMYGRLAQTPSVKNSSGSITFTFKGGAPGATTLTTESVVTVFPSGAVNLDYNGPSR